MEIIDTKNLIGGWFVGNFSPTVYKTEQCEVAYKHHFPGEDWPEHYHQHTDEINYLLTGKMEINGQKIEGPCIFIIKKGEIAKPKFITTVALIVVRVPGIPNDKIVVNAPIYDKAHYESHMVYDEKGNSIGIMGNTGPVCPTGTELPQNDLLNILGNRITGKRKKTPRKAK